MAKEDTKNAPRMLDSEARLDSTIGINKQFRYNLTMINWLESDPHVPAFKQRMLSEIRNYVCTAEKMKFFVRRQWFVIFWRCGHGSIRSNQLHNLIEQASPTEL